MQIECVRKVYYTLNKTVERIVSEKIVPNSKKEKRPFRITGNVGRFSLSRLEIITAGER